MAVNTSGLVRAALALREVEPALWAGFVGAMEEYARDMTAEMLRASPEMLLRAQGMSIMAHEIAGILLQAPTIHEKALEAQRRQHHGRPGQARI